MVIVVVPMEKKSASQYQKEYRSHNKKRLDEYQRDYRLTHKERTKCYYVENKEKFLEYSKQYYEDHRVQYLEYQKIHRGKHRIENIEYQKEYYASNKERLKITAQQNKDKYKCETCNYFTFQKCNLNAHLKSKKHLNAHKMVYFDDY